MRNGLHGKSGFTVPAGYSLTGGMLTVANQTSEAPTPIALTAVNAEGSSDKTFSVQARVPAAIVSSEVYRYRLLIAGIDVSGDLLAIPNIHQSLDVINPNEFVSDDASFTLRSPEGRYDGRVAGNFWDAHRLNTNGYLSEIALWVDILDTGTVQSKLLFQGLILEVQSSLNSVKATSQLRRPHVYPQEHPRRSRGDREVFSRCVPCKRPIKASMPPKPRCYRFYETPRPSCPVAHPCPLRPIRTPPKRFPANPRAM